MAVEKISYHFISRDSPYYHPAVMLRHNVFYHNSGAQMDQLLDNKEGRSTHLVATYGEEVIGYIRITLDGKIAYLSQFVVAPEMQGKSNVAKTLYATAMSKAKEMGAKKVSGEIRLPMTGIASKLGYKIHQSISTSDDGSTQHHAEKEL
ncbi:GNAT family N-acetyltransferase [Chloroflexota bacterium]